MRMLFDRQGRKQKFPALPCFMPTCVTEVTNHALWDIVLFSCSDRYSSWSNDVFWRLSDFSESYTDCGNRQGFSGRSAPDEDYSSFFSEGNPLEVPCTKKLLWLQWLNEWNREGSWGQRPRVSWPGVTSPIKVIRPDGNTCIIGHWARANNHAF